MQREARSDTAPEATPARVYLVGAGPGDPELLTLKAARLLAAADVVLYDALVDPRILALAPQARLVNVGKRGGGASTAQRFINRVLVSSARRHRCVIRLKGGDPTLFGRLDEETQALRVAGISFAVVPGVTAACAAAASAGISLTLRGVSRAATFATPRAARGARVSVPGGGDDTLVVYMAGQLLADLAQQLIADGRSPGTPLIVVESASLPHERRWAGTLGSAGHWPGPMHDGPVLLLIGPALAAAVDQQIALLDVAA